MSTPPAEGDGSGPKTRAERLAALRKELVEEFGEKRGQELFRQIQATSLTRVGPESWVNVIDPSHVGDIFEKIWEKGLAGISRSELLEVDELLTQNVARRRLVLRFFRFYVQDEEYAAIDTAFQLLGVLRDKSGHSPNRDKLKRALYDRLRRLRYGNRILNQASVGWLENATYVQMRELEKRLSPAGRAHGAEAEAIAQIFYRSLEPQPTRIWIRSQDDPTDLFGEIAYRLLGGGPTIPFLDLYAMPKAGRVRDEAVDDFLASYSQFEIKRVELGDSGSYVRIQRKARP